MIIVVGNMSENKKKYKSGAAKRKWREESSANTKRVNTFFATVPRDRTACGPALDAEENTQPEENAQPDQAANSASNDESTEVTVVMTENSGTVDQVEDSDGNFDSENIHDGDIVEDLLFTEMNTHDKESAAPGLSLIHI